MAEASVIKTLRRALGRRPTVDELDGRGQNAAPTGLVMRAVSRVAAIVFPVNASGNNRSMR